jgi:hypothetical protein
MPLLRPFRDYSEKDVLNIYTFSGQTSTSQIINRGTLVQVVGQGFRNDNDPVNIIGTYGDFSVNNVQALRYGTPAQVTYYGTGTGAAATSGGFPGEYPLGLTLFDVRELDENLIPLKYNPRKAAELEACISGQSVPVVVRGTFLYSGLTGSFNGGAPIYGAANGTITAQPLSSGTTIVSTKVGIALGATGVDGSALIRLTLN